MRSRSGINFINILRAAFTNPDPKSAKKSDDMTLFFVLLGSAHVIAVGKNLVKLTPGWQRCPPNCTSSPESNSSTCYATAFKKLDHFMY